MVLAGKESRHRVPVGTALLVTATMRVSGHLNPAVTLAHALRRGFPWRKVPSYWAAQVFGAMLIAANPGYPKPKASCAWVTALSPVSITSRSARSTRR